MNSSDFGVEIVEPLSSRSSTNCRRSVPADSAMPTRRATSDSGSANSIRQEIRDDHRPGRAEQRLLQHILQLADIARPGIVHQQFQRLGRDAVHVFAELTTENGQVVCRAAKRCRRAVRGAARAES